MHFRALVISAILAGLTTMSPATAAGPSKFVTHLMGREPGEGKTFACFIRVYDDAHLTAHPEQNVRSMTVLVVAYSVLQYSYQLRMGFHFRGRLESLTTVAECGDSSGARDSLRGGALCAGPGESGKMRLVLEDDRSVLIVLPVGAHLWRPGPPDPTNTVNDAFGPDDKLFRLFRTALLQCDDQAIDDEEKAFLDRDSAGP
jgi:hypothetical protein